MPIDKSQITAVILAGGGARRMGGKEKGLVPLAGRTLIAHVIDRITPQVGTILINANRHLEQYRQFGLEVIEDHHHGSLGPLAGIAAALRRCDSDYLLVVPCDTPYLPHDLAQRLAGKLQQQGEPVVSVDDGERRHPVILLLHRSLLANIETFLVAGGRALHDWLATVAHSYCDFSDQPDAFININTFAELKSEEERRS